MSIENLPFFSALNREEVKPCFPQFERPLTMQEDHVLILQRVNACISQLQQFEQRIKFEFEKFMNQTGTENNGFKEAIQSSYNAFMQTIQNEINNFETDLTNNFSLHKSDIDLRISEFQTVINNEFKKLENSIVTVSNNKLDELEQLKIDLNRLFKEYKAVLLETVDNFKSQINEHIEMQDTKIEEYKKYMVDNIMDSTESIFNQKAQNGEITALMSEVYGNTRKFMGSLTYDEILALTSASNGDYYYCTTDGHYYQKTETTWVDIGNGDKIVDDYETYKMNNDVKVNEILNQLVLFDKNILSSHHYEKEHDGVKLYDGVESERFTLEKGKYRLIVVDTNMKQLVLQHSVESDKVLHKPGLTKGFYDFEVDENNANIPLYFYFNCSTNVVNQEGLYYIDVFLYKINDDGYTNFDYLTSSNINTLIDDALVSSTKNIIYKQTNISHKHNGEQTYDSCQLQPLSLTSGNYKAIVLNNNGFVGLYLTKIGGTERVIAKTIREQKFVEHNFTVSDELSGSSFYFFLNASNNVAETEGTKTCDFVYILKDDGEPLLPEFITRHNEIIDYCNQKIDAINPIYESKNGFLNVKADSLSDGVSMTHPKRVNVKKNKTLAFSCKISDFVGLRIGHGKSMYGGSYIEIDNTNITNYDYYTSANKGKTSEHGLTFSDFLTVIIDVKTSRASFTIMTASGMFKVEDVAWSGCNGTIFAEPIGCTITDCELSWTTADINKRTWVFGDSYLGLTSSSRYPYYILQLGHENWLASGYPGGDSVAELETFKTLLTIGTPKTVVWCMGMNDGDNDTINTNWLSSLEELKTICEQHKINLVLATIPSCPKVDNTYKNTYVKESGYRYVDFEKAVVVSGTQWYEGMLSDDEVHPSELGAKALANRFILDVPEIAQ